MGKKFEVVDFNEYFELFEVNIYTEGNEEPETENLPAVFDPKFEKEVEEKGEYAEVLYEWECNEKEPIIGFEYKGETILLKDLNL